MSKNNKVTILKKSFILAGIVSILLTMFKLSILPIYLVSFGFFLIAIGISFNILEEDIDDKKCLKTVICSMVIFSIAAMLLI